MIATWHSIAHQVAAPTLSSTTRSADADNEETGIVNILLGPGDLAMMRRLWGTDVGGTNELEGVFTKMTVTHNPPSAKTATSAIFRLLGSCNDLNTGIGRRRMMRLPRTCIAKFQNPQSFLIQTEFGNRDFRKKSMFRILQ